MAALKAEHRAILEAAERTGGLAPNTRRDYETGWRQFGAWLASEYPGVTPIMADAEHLAMFLYHLRTDRGYAASTLYARWNAINFYRREAGKRPFSTSTDTGLARIMDAARREGGPRKQAAALRKADCDRIVAMLEHRASCGRVDRTSRRGNLTYANWPHRPGPRCSEHAVSPGKRLQALAAAAYIRLGFGCLLRISETLAARWSDISEHPDAPGAGILFIRRSKTDQYGEGAFSTVTPEAMAALAALRVALPDAREGDRILASRAVKTYQNMLRNGARDAGLTVPGTISTHSLRVGGATEMAARGASAFEIMAAGRWRKIEHAERYVQQAGPARRDSVLAYLG